jgi:squalene-hopene/tetraprenyl-beta-curcumene cyclase
MKCLLAIITNLLLAGITRAADLPSQTDVSLLNEVARAQDRGLTWLVKQQQPDGSWNHHPAITGLALTALTRNGAEQADAVNRAVKFILANVQTNGAIYSGGRGDEYPNYSTAICAMALLATGKPEVMDAVKNARRFLIASQFDEGEGYSTNNPSYGGIGYGKRQRPDMSNTQLALEAIRLTESLETRASDESPHTATRLHWKKAVEFLQHCQNLPAVNDQPWAKNVRAEDVGGAIYMPGDPAQKIPAVSFADDESASKDPKEPLRSYGSMTYAMLKSYIYAELKKDDPRVKAAVEWLRRNYTVEENPAMGQQGLFYYYHTVAKALTVYGDDTITDAKGKVHDWRYELMKKFVTLQRADGFWQNENNRWWENDPVLCTSYSLISLGILQSRRYP